MATLVPNDESCPPLRIDSVAKRFGKVIALDGVSFAVEQRACFGLLGPNGAGKSTLIRCIVGRLRPDSGGVRIFGHPANSAAAREAIGWVPQELAVYSLLTCRENLDSFGRYHGLRGRKLHESIEWCLEWAGLTEHANITVKAMSGGMRRRLSLAAGVIHRPRLVLLDEPTVGVDPQSRNRIFDMVTGLRDQGTTVIYTTHYMEEAERLCDVIAIIDHGRVITQGTKAELVAQSFGGCSDVLMRFSSTHPGATQAATEWAASLGGSLDDGVAHFSLARPADVASLLDAASLANLDVIDVVLRRPNLESVFLKLTGKELRT